MAVLARNRKTSQMEFWHTAVKLRRSMYFLMMKDFGVKDKVRDVRSFTKGMEPQDADLLVGVLERYHIRKVNMYWPEWVITRLRENACASCDALLRHIEAAMACWPQMRVEHEYRRVQQDKAIGDCQNLLSILSLAVDVLPVDADKFRTQVEYIEKEQGLLKGWRKGDNKRFKGLS